MSKIRNINSLTLRGLAVLAVVAIAVSASLLFTGRSEASHALCDSLPNHDSLMNAITDARNDPDGNGGFNLDMWGTVVDQDGVVCQVAFTGQERGDQWPGSRVISAQKANTANAFSLPGLSLSTANLFTAVQPGGSLFGLQASNPVDTSVAYGGDPTRAGMHNDPMVGKRIGGVNVFGGGLALYESDGTLIGALGVSGDSSCADHNIAWKTRDSLGLDNIPGGVSGTGDDNIVLDLEFDSITKSTGSPSGWGHPDCSSAASAIANELPTSHAVGE